ncbi:unnamed protein product [Polarella glacialis]|uniref:Uncharacterized protein n=1 Tax=Polarella glacialis TaxID=89957 RepID=A0A813FJA7_POLGL|nr:unnamed protein product [Polarella glacialis]CAE8644065.1 unnamed protein product [Polarella glacialis]
MAETWQPRRRRGRCRDLLLAGLCAAAVRLNNNNDFSGSARGHQLQSGTSFVSRARLPCQSSLAGEAFHGGILGASASLQPPCRQFRANVRAGPQTHQVLSPTLGTLNTISPETQGSATFPCYCSACYVHPCVRKCTGSLPAANLITAAEQAAAEKAARLKALDALAAGGLQPGQELELVSALDLGTVPWSEVPVSLKQALQLPAADKGIDSLALNLSLAVQAKDYTDGKTVPMARLTNFHFLATAGPLGQWGPRLVVATNASTQLPREWERLAGAEQRRYSSREVEAWRLRAQQWAAELQDDEVAASPSIMSPRWPHQLACMQACRAALRKESQRDFFVQIATGAGKSLIMADLFSELGEGQRACIIVPKLDLMDQIAQLLESLALSGGLSRVGTGHMPDMEARVFVCVRNSAWRLADLSFDVLILDEAHHYEPGLVAVNDDKELLDEGLDPSSHATDAALGPHASTVLSLHAHKRIFFSATLRRHQPDFDFGLREAVRAGVITDYTILVPFITDGDPKPSLVELIRNLPTARRILAFCNTVHEAKHFAQLLNSAGVPAGHYNGCTDRSKRVRILELFEKGPARGGIRVLVTVDVLSEGVDLPMADTCMFVEPRRGLRLRQCVGRVLRRHLQKVDALVISPPIVQKASGDLEADTELIRLLSELASADHELQNSLVQDSFGRIGIVDQRGELQDDTPDLAREEAARLLATSVYPRALSANHAATILWELGFAGLEQYVYEHGDCRVPSAHHNTAGFSLGQWVQARRRERRSGNLSVTKIEKLDKLGFIWNSDLASWQQGCRQLVSFKQAQGHTNVPVGYVTCDGFKLGHWVKNKRSSKRGKPGSPHLDDDRAQVLTNLGFVWDLHLNWEQGVQRLEAYKAEHGHSIVPKSHVTADGFLLGIWVSNQRKAKRGTGSGTLDQYRLDILDKLGFVWDPISLQWELGVQHLQAYKAEHGDTFVQTCHVTDDGFRLGVWVSRQRRAKRGTGTGTLDQYRVDILDKLGFVWEAMSL